MLARRQSDAVVETDFVHPMRSATTWFTCFLTRVRLILRVTLTFFPSSFRRYSTIVVIPFESVVSTRGGNSEEAFNRRRQFSRSLGVLLSSIIERAVSVESRSRGRGGARRDKSERRKFMSGAVPDRRARTRRLRCFPNDKSESTLRASRP